jgi:hypothetical protein
MQNTVRNIRFYHELSNALDQLNRAGIPAIVLKGAYLSEIVYKDVGRRYMEDVDILFRKKDLGQAQKCLDRAGYYHQNSRLPIDIHWYLEQYLDLDMEKIWERAQTTVIGEVETLTLSPEDHIVHLCMHLSFHHTFQFFGLRTFCDIREVVNHYGRKIEWKKVKNRSEEWGVRNGVYLSLLLAKEITGARIPDDALKDLKPDIHHVEAMEWALNRIFDKSQSASEPILSPYFWQIWGIGSFGEKISSLVKLLIPSREFISQKYPTIFGTKRNYYYYLIRLKDHFIRYLVIIFRILRQDKSTTRLVREKKQDIAMTRWIVSNKRLL